MGLFTPGLLGGVPHGDAPDQGELAGKPALYSGDPLTKRSVGRSSLPQTADPLLKRKGGEGQSWDRAEARPGSE